jgi:hypothetical protein
VISPSGTITVEKGSNKAFTVTPTSGGFAISDVKVDGVNIKNSSVYNDD